MTDLHTHILPGMDDGAATPEDSLNLLRLEQQQGVDTVVLTPHFYRDRERPEDFIRRRTTAAQALARRLAELPEEERRTLPRLRLGAEVAWWPNLADCEELPLLCIEGTKNLLLELPVIPWSGRVLGQVCDLMGRTGITPVIAHLERYLKLQRAEYIRELLALGLPVQVSGDVLLHLRTRGGTLGLLQQHRAHLIASDCHNTASRAPNMGSAMKVVEKKLGKGRVAELIRCADELAGVGGRR